MKKFAVMVSVTITLAYGAMAQNGESAPVQPASRPTATSQAGKILKFPGLLADLDKRRIVMDTEVCLTEGSLELLVCAWNTKEHESILRTHAKAAHLHAALLALGLTQGIAAHWTAPNDDGKLIPPRGPELKITLRWKDQQGAQMESDAANWISAGENRKPLPISKWVFVGSEISPNGEYVADNANYGHIISVSNFPDTVIDVPFESTDKDAELVFAANTKSIPPKGTAVQVVITPTEGAQKSPFARALLEIDRLGQMRMDGKPIAVDELEKWASGFTEVHERGMVVIRAEGQVPVFNVEMARQELRVGGVRDFEEQFLSPEQPLLPRTAQQVEQAMKEWAAKFSRPGDYVVEPSQEVQDTLRDIARQIQELDGTRELWKSYEVQLRKAVQEYQASTRPVGGKPDGK